MKFIISTILFLLTHIAFAIDANSYYQEKTKTFVTEASIHLNVPQKTVSDIGMDFAHYRDWALPGINGGEGNPRKFISILNDILYDKHPEPNGKFIVVYDVDLIFPFRRKDEKLNFKMASLKVLNGMVESYALNLDGSSMVIKNFNLDFHLSKENGNGSLITFRSETQLHTIFNAFFSLSRYRNNIEWRILKIVENLQNKIQK